MKSKFIDENISYDGTQLRSLYNYLEHKLLGDSIVSWVGPCDVSFDHMVDGEDILQKSTIKASKMLHFIIEVFDRKLLTAVCLQRIFAEIFISYIQKKSPNKNISAEVTRCGDDIYYQNKKFNISIATVSPASCLIHFAVNVDGKDAPVPTLSLNDFALDPRQTSLNILELFVAEYTHMLRATQKVKWVQ